MYANGTHTKKRHFKGIEKQFEQPDESQPDYTKAKEWFEKAANQGHIEAQHQLALLYYNGQGLNKIIHKELSGIPKRQKKVM